MLSRGLSRHVATVATQFSAQGVTPASYNYILPTITRFLNAKPYDSALLISSNTPRCFSTSPCALAPRTSAAGAAEGSTSAAKPRKKRAGSSQKAKPKKTAKAKKKPGPKPKKKKPVKKRPKPLTEHEKLIKKVKQYKPRALLNEPKRLPEQSFVLFHTRVSTPGLQATKMIQASSARYKALSAGERQQLTDEANANRVKNQRALNSWIATHTPDQIRVANSARRVLNRISDATKKPGSKRLVARSKILKDDRRPRPPLTPYLQYSMERRASGDFAGVRSSEASKAIGREWKALDAQEKQRRQAEYQPLHDAYMADFRAIYPQTKVYDTKGTQTRA